MTWTARMFDGSLCVLGPDGLASANDGAVTRYVRVAPRLAAFVRDFVDAYEPHHLFALVHWSSPAFLHAIGWWDSPQVRRRSGS